MKTDFMYMMKAIANYDIVLCKSRDGYYALRAHYWEKTDEVSLQMFDREVNDWCDINHLDVMDVANEVELYMNDGEWKKFRKFIFPSS